MSNLISNVDNYLLFFSLIKFSLLDDSSDIHPHLKSGFGKSNYCTLRDSHKNSKRILKKEKRKKQKAVAKLLIFQ